LITKIGAELKTLKQKYVEIKSSHFGVVYVIKGNWEQFDGWHHDLLSGFNNEVRPKMDILPKTILAKILFKNGIERFRPYLN
jgi:hypothetical protein